METPYVRACTNCVRAKAKCSPTSIVDAEGKCERCHRMKKVCQPSPPMRRHRTLKKSHAHETSKLEEKLDGLVTLLKSAAQSVPGIINPTLGPPWPEGLMPVNHDSSFRSTATREVDYGVYNTRIRSPNLPGISESDNTPTTSSSSRPTPSSHINSQTLLDPSLEPSPEDAESYLTRFRNDFIKHLPFIVISPTTTAHQLRQDRPILWISIMTVASGRSTEQIALSKEFRGLLGREAFVEGTRNIDILLAILVYATWDRCFHSGKPVLMSLIQLAIAVSFDLGIDKAPSRDPALMLAYDLKGSVKPARFSRTPTTEERRALLGCFVMSSVSSSSLRKGTSMRWTAYSNDCLRIIEAAQEFQSDALLVQLVKLRLISERVNDLPWSSLVIESDVTMKTPAMFYLKTLEAQLHDFRSNIPSDLSNNQTLLMELYTTELNIYDVGMSHTPETFVGEPNRRIECLWATLKAIKSWIDTFLSIPPAQYVGMSALIYSSMTHCFIAIYRLSTFEHPEWDRMLFHEHLNVSAFLEHAEKNFLQVKEAAGLDIGGSKDLDFFSGMGPKFQSIKKLWDATNAFSMADADMPSNNEMFDFSMEFADEDWLRDMLGSWND